MLKKYYKLINGELVFFTGNILNINSEEGNSVVTRTIINPTEELLLGDGWILYEETPEELLLIAKTNKINDIILYDNSSNVNSFTINGVNMWLDHNLRQQIKTSVEAYLTSGVENVTKIFDGVEYTFSTGEWLEMLVALEIYASECFNVTERHKNNVLSLETVEEVEQYDNTTGYPEKVVLSAK